MRYTVPQPASSVHAVASNNARTPHTTCVATAGFATPHRDVSVNMRTMRVYLVGGALRDRLLGVPVRERDWVVVGAQPQELERAGYLPVGREFPVFLHPQTHEEYALARRERKVAPGYRGFTTQSSPEVTLGACCARGRRPSSRTRCASCASRASPPATPTWASGWPMRRCS